MKIWAIEMAQLIKAPVRKPDNLNLILGSHGKTNPATLCHDLHTGHSIGMNSCTQNK